MARRRPSKNAQAVLDARAAIRTAQKAIASLPANWRREATALILAEYLDRARERADELAKGVEGL